MQHLDLELARAEAVVEAASDSRKKAHEPTVENHKGQIAALRKAKALLEMEQITPSGPVVIDKTYTITIPWKTIIVTVLVSVFLF